MDKMTKIVISVNGLISLPMIATAFVISNGVLFAIGILIMVMSGFSLVVSDIKDKGSI